MWLNENVEHILKAYMAWKMYEQIQFVGSQKEVYLRISIILPSLRLW